MSRYSKTDIRRRLTEYEGDDPFIAGNIEVVLTMPEDQSAPILQATANLANKLRSTGPYLAFEIVCKAARYLAQ